MKVLVFGSGGREHALTWKLRQSQLTEDIYCAPGNAGIAQEAECVPIDLSTPEEMLRLAKDLGADLAVAGPEAPLAAGAADAFQQAGLAFVGPVRQAARLESSKIFAKQFMARHSVPTARFAVATDFEQAIRTLSDFALPVVVKADGLAGGKGVVVAKRRDAAEQALEDFMRRELLGPAGERVVIEEGLAGEELSFMILTDGRAILPLPPSQDHKRLLDSDLGPNTGGMGAYSDDALLDERLRSSIQGQIVAPTLEGLNAEGIVYRGFLYFGLMLTSEGPKLLEYNVRLGDPEAQPVLIRLGSDLGELLRSTLDGTLGAREAHWSPNPAVSVVLASQGYPGRPVLGKAIAGFDLAEKAGGVKVFHAGTAVRDHQLVTTGGRVLAVTASGETLAAAIDRAYSAVSKISFEGVQYRRDIGARGLARPPASTPARENHSVRQEASRPPKTC